MALNILTDKEFDEALHWLAKKEGKTKSDLIRSLILDRFRNKRQGFQFGSLAPLIRGKKRISAKKILKELKEIDRDHDLD